MADWEDLYQLLDVAPDAEADAIRQAYRAKAREHHPDRMPDASEEERRAAEEKLKVVNAAYAVLGDVTRRERYHQEWMNRLAPPRPSVDPAFISFSDVSSREPQTGAFVVRNLGGPYTNISVSNPDSWVSITSYESLTDEDELPLRVFIRAEGMEPGKSYSQEITVGLDNEQVQVQVGLRTTGRARATTPRDTSRPRVGTVYSSSSAISGARRSAQGVGERSASGLSVGIWWGAVIGAIIAALFAVYQVVISFDSPMTIAIIAPASAIFAALIGGAVGALVGAVGGTILGFVFGTISR
jgi:curved DNA-binding protein CbpA